MRMDRGELRNEQKVVVQELRVVLACAYGMARAAAAHKTTGTFQSRAMTPKVEGVAYDTTSTNSRRGPRLHLGNAA
jgi:hypothetical protein